MQKEQKTTIGIVVGTLIVVAGLAYVFASGGSTRVVEDKGYEELAQCITDSGAKFYAAFWCPYCQEQKRSFRSGSEMLPYIECSTPNGQGQLEICAEAGVTSYPTWEFANGQRIGGAIAPRSLAEVTGCPYPYDDTEVEEVEVEPTESSPAISPESMPELETELVSEPTPEE